MGAKGSTSAKKGLTTQEINVLKANTKMSETDIREAYDEFIAENPSGKISKAQFRKLYAKIADPKVAGDHIADVVFQVFDTNNDGTITFNEFAIGVALQGKNDLDSGLELAFTMIDTSHDGNITFNEMVKFLELSKKAVNDSGDADATMYATFVYGMFGLDKSQKISKQQFLEGVKNNENLKEMFSGFASS